jgi:hypothetical protein
MTKTWGQNIAVCPQGPVRAGRGLWLPAARSSSSAPLGATALQGAP